MIHDKRQALLWGSLFIFLLAFVLHVKQIFVMFAALGILAPISYLLGRPKLEGIVVERHGATVMTAGEWGTVFLTLRNQGRFRQFLVEVRDGLPRELGSAWTSELLVADLVPGAEMKLKYSLWAARRGVFKLGPPRVEASDFLGLYRFSRQCGSEGEVIVYPRTIPMPNLWPRPMGGRQPDRPRVRRLGPSTEFYGLRDYQVGDDLRRVDWKITARRGKLTVVETEQSDTREVVVVVDLDARWHTGDDELSTLEYTMTLAASLAEEALGRGCDVGLIAQGREDHSVPVKGDPRQRLRIMEALARADADAERGLAEILVAHEKQLPPGCTVAVISASTDPTLSNAATRLQVLRHPVLWFALDPSTFAEGDEGPPKSPQHAALVAQLAAHGVRVVPISGETTLEANLWGRSGGIRRS